MGGGEKRMSKNKITKCNDLMFCKVKCKSYMKKINDGRYIQYYGANETESGEEEYEYVDMKTDTWEKIGEEDYETLNFLKTYRQKVEKEFIGVVVGMKMVDVSAYLYLDYHKERRFVNKQIKEQVKCALVYYGCNRSRYVLFDDLEVIEEKSNNE